ncbi:MAG: response regulator transcription factor [Leptolyngbya sp. SIOISBB]|nr:response regulator transcription factor [Leptolyngbya sp. SIOISBB]
MRILVCGDLDNFTGEYLRVFKTIETDVYCCTQADLIPFISRDKPDVVCVQSESSFTSSAQIIQLQELFSVTESRGYRPILVGIVPHETQDAESSTLFDLGVDLVFEKPIRPASLKQILAFDRRVREKNELTSPHLLLDIKTQDCYIKAEQGMLLSNFRVSAIQFIIIKVLTQTPRGIWSREQLLQKIGNEIEGDNPSQTLPDIRLVDKNIYRLRQSLSKKIDEIEHWKWSLAPGYKYPFIQTEEGAGYYFCDALVLKETVPSRHHYTQQSSSLLLWPRSHSQPHRREA